MRRVHRCELDDCNRFLVAGTRRCVTHKKEVVTSNSAYQQALGRHRASTTTPTHGSPAPGSDKR